MRRYHHLYQRRRSTLFPPAPHVDVWGSIYFIISSLVSLHFPQPSCYWERVFGLRKPTRFPLVHTSSCGLADRIDTPAPRLPPSNKLSGLYFLLLTYVLTISTAEITNFSKRAQETNSLLSQATVVRWAVSPTGRVVSSTNHGTSIAPAPPFSRPGWPPTFCRCGWWM